MGDERANRIDVARVERLARDLIMGFGLPVELVGVRHDAPHWLVIGKQVGRSKRSNSRTTARWRNYGNSSKIA